MHLLVPFNSVPQVRASLASSKPWSCQAEPSPGARSWERTQEKEKLGQGYKGVQGHKSRTEQRNQHAPQESVGTCRGQTVLRSSRFLGFCCIVTIGESVQKKNKEPTFENPVYGKRLVAMQGALSSLQAEAQPCRGLLQRHCADSGLLCRRKHMGVVSGVLFSQAQLPWLMLAP